MSDTRPTTAAPLRILVTGSRDWEAAYVISHAMFDAWVSAGRPANVTLVSGRCPTGADAMAERVAADAHWVVEPHPADWKTYRRRAGFVRNAEMVALGADLVLAFIRNDSRGASMTLDLATQASIPTVVWRVNAPPPPAPPAPTYTPFAVAVRLAR